MSVMDFTDLYVDVDISRTSTFRAKALRQEVVVNGSLRNVYLIIFIAMIQKGVMIWQAKSLLEGNMPKFDYLFFYIRL